MLANNFKIETIQISKMFLMKLTIFIFKIIISQIQNSKIICKKMKILSNFKSQKIIKII